MRALVTGGAGFIGSHLAEALCLRGDHVIVLDDLSAGSPTNLSWRTAAHRLDFITGDAGDEALVAPLLKGVDCVFHLAAMASVSRSVHAPEESNRRNLDATLKLLCAARGAGVKRVVFASSAAVYGDANAQATHEEVPPKPLSPYALQKYASEKYGQLFWRLYGLPVVSLRYFNVFGPRQSLDSAYTTVIPRFCCAALDSEPVRVYGDGCQTRDFTYVENVVSANLLAASAPLEKIAGRVFNCASGNTVSILELANALATLLNKPVRHIAEAAHPGDIRHSLADIGLIRRDLGYQVLVDWQEGLRRTVEFYRGKREPSSALPAGDDVLSTR